MANSLTTSIMKNLSKKLVNQNLDKNQNKVSKEKEISNLKRNEEEILLTILHKGRNKVKLNYSYKEENESNIKMQSIKNLANNNTNIIKEDSNNKQIKKITSLRDLAK